MAGYVRAETRRAQLLVAANDVLIRDGLDALTMRSVATAGDVRLSMLQYIFPTRAELVSALTNYVLVNSGTQNLVIGDRGLAIELPAVLNWYADDVLSNDALVELIRHEVLTTAGIRTTESVADYPLTGALLGEVATQRWREIAEKSGETYDLPIDSLARLWTQILSGLTHQFLLHRDLGVFRADAQFAAEAMISLACGCRGV